MLRSFVVTNYRSFRNPAELSMTAANIKSVNKALDTDNVFKIASHSLLRSAVIYGANASGKSNIIKAIGHMRSMVLSFSSQRNPGETLGQPFKLNVQSLDQPTSFEVEFFIEGIKYRYGFDVLENTVLAEWLYYVPKKREVILFHRVGETLEKISNTFKKEGDGLISKTRSDTLYLAVVNEFNGEISRSVVDWFKNLLIIKNDTDFLMQLSSQIAQSSMLKRLIVDFLGSFDSGIIDIELLNKDENNISDYDKKFAKMISEASTSAIWEKLKKVKTRHILYDGKENLGFVDFDLNSEESDGTKKIFAISPIIIVALLMGFTIFVDEFDSSLHTRLTQGILDLFNNKESNSKNSQIIITTHDTNLLNKEIFRRDQIWFVEKTLRGESSFFSLVEYKTRNDAVFEKDYLSGRYGGVPFINTSTLVSHLSENGESDFSEHSHAKI